MPDADGFPTPDEIVRGSNVTPAPVVQKPLTAPSLAGMTPNQQKAICIVMSGRPFLTIGMVPTLADGSPGRPGQEATGCDFHTVAEGDKETLLAVKAHLADVIDRLYKRHGWM